MTHNSGKAKGNHVSDQVKGFLLFCSCFIVIMFLWRVVYFLRRIIKQSLGWLYWSNFSHLCLLYCL